tara:strand:- start:7914 stop:8108 length:195 start_codon:yes stop_codon:yes gene_type:complete
MSAEQRDSIIRRVLRGAGFLAMVFTLCYCQIQAIPISEGFWGVIGVMFTFFYAAEKAESEGTSV